MKAKDKQVIKEEELPFEELFVNQLKSDNNPIEVTMYINNKLVEMEIDTGAPLSLIWY